MKAIAIAVMVLAAVAGARAQCSGACQDNSNYCPNAYQAGLCPGPANIECCPEPTPNCNGQCQDNSLPCDGSYESGDCPGPDNVQCCAASSPSGGCSGACQDNSNYCPNSYQAGLCPGPANIECCPEPTPNCNGQCQDNSLPCNGQYVSGDCPGPDNVQCCTSSGPAPGSGCQPFADAEWNCVDPGCSSTVPAGSPQPNYACAEFVSRSLASAGYIPGLGPYDSQGAYSGYVYNGVTYDLCWTSSKSGGGILGLEDFLEAAGWPNGGAVGDCTVVLVATDSYESHVVIGVAPDTVDAHNNARYHVPPSYYNINNVYNPPSLWNRTRVVHTRPNTSDMPKPSRAYYPPQPQPQPQHNQQHNQQQNAQHNAQQNQQKPRHVIKLQP